MLCANMIRGKDVAKKSQDDDGDDHGCTFSTEDEDVPGDKSEEEEFEDVPGESSLTDESEIAFSFLLGHNNLFLEIAPPPVQIFFSKVPKTHVWEMKYSAFQQHAMSSKEYLN